MLKENAVADSQENGEREQESGTVLVAHVTVHLESGEEFELLPFEDTLDVKSKVSDLIGAWAKSGFLIQGNHIYPWHRVKLIEATRVEELSRGESKQQREAWESRDTERLQQSFWRTKRAREKKEDEGEEKGGKSHEPAM